MARTLEQSLPNKKEQSRLSRVPDHEGGDSRWAREGDQSEERVDSTVNEGRFQGGEGGQARRASLGEVGGMSG